MCPPRWDGTGAVPIGPPARGLAGSATEQQRGLAQHVAQWARWDARAGMPCGDGRLVAAAVAVLAADLAAVADVLVAAALTVSMGAAAAREVLVSMAVNAGSLAGSPVGVADAARTAGGAVGREVAAEGVAGGGRGPGVLLLPCCSTPKVVTKLLQLLQVVPYVPTLPILNLKRQKWGCQTRHPSRRTVNPRGESARGNNA